MKLNNIKDKFENREIQPSVDSWEKLSNRLDTVEKKERKPMVIWFSAIAAILVLGLIVVPSLFFNDSMEPLENPIVIENPADKETILKDEIKEPASATSNKKTEAIATTEAETVKTTKQPKANKRQPIITEKIKAIITNDIAFETPEKDQLEILETQDAIASQESNVEELQMTAPISEADALLNNALKNLKVQNTAVASSTTINPNKLLRETEWDLEARNRNRLENTLLDGLGKLKREAVALIDRNQ